MRRAPLGSPLRLVLGLLLGTLGPSGCAPKARSGTPAPPVQLHPECAEIQQRPITFEEERSFGDAVSLKWVSTGGGLTTRNAEALHVQLNKLGRNLAAQSSRPNLPWVFGVLQSEGVNAVSGPGGYVFVSEGLLAQVDNEAQLAGVLAHEIAHITGRHALHEYQNYLVRQCEDSFTTDTVVNVLSGAFTLGKPYLGSLADSVPTPVALREVFTLASRQAEGLNFDRLGPLLIRAITEAVVAHLSEKGLPSEDELAADNEAVDLMAAAGYAPEAYVDFLARLPEKGKLTTPHPPKGERQHALRTHLQSLRELASKPGFTTSVDLSATRVIPLRDELLERRTLSAPPAPPPEPPR